MKPTKKLLFFIIAAVFISGGVAKAQDSWDPLEPMNRGIFWFNEKADVYVLEPVANGYDYVMPDFAKKGVSNFIDNIKFPVLLVGDLLQLKFGQALNHTGRFLVNTTVGVAGFMDIATDWGLKPHKEDVGVALGYWGVDEGPYLVLPFLGPSNFRDAVSFGGEIFLDPVYWMKDYTDMPGRERFWAQAGYVAVRTIDQRYRLLDAVKSGRESSLDYYLFVRSAYHQYRQGLIYDGNAPDQEEDVDVSVVDVNADEEK